jgi:integrase
MKGSRLDEERIAALIAVAKGPLASGVRSHSSYDGLGRGAMRFNAASSGQRLMPAKMQRTRYPGIFKRGSRYVVVWRHRGRQHKESFRTIADARESQGRRRMPGERQPPSRQWFEDYARQWLDSYQGRTARGLSESTRADYRRSIEGHAIPFFQRYRLSEIDPPDVRAFVRSLADGGMRTSSVRKNVAPLKALLATAVDDGALRSNPSLGQRIQGSQDPADAPKKVRAMTREELRLVLAALPEESRTFFTFLAHTGLRISEALAVSWGDLDLGVVPCVRVRRQIYKGRLKALKSKHSERDVPLTPAMAATLLAVRAMSYRGDDDATVFATSLGTPLNAHNLRHRVLQPSVRAIGLEWVGFHTFRHTCASLLFGGGKDVKQIQQWLGHADPGFTLRTYVHLLDDGLGKADFLDADTSLSAGLGTFAPA